MKRLNILTIAILAVSASFATDPSYSSQKTKKLIQKMIKAHGGMDKWRNAPTISYTHDMIDPSEPEDHWLSEEVHEQGRRRSYHNWTSDQALLVNDGNEVWTVDWKRLNPPTMMSGVSYFFINIAWVTQDDIANLELKESTSVDLIEEGKEFHTIRLTFAGSSPYEYFDMYIDPKTYLLRGVLYTVTDKDLFKVFGLPETTEFMGPVLKVYKEYTDVDGLSLTTRYDTYTPNGKTYGIHTVTNYDLRKEFDESKLAKPGNAVVFKSSFK
ncbi:MAG: hypothetical protein ABJG78_02240 [Cyclobacteriaceae bacterium]